MPIVSVNLSQPAYFIYEEWKKERRGSEKISSAVIRYEHMQRPAGELAVGDKRFDKRWDEYLVWDGERWVNG